MFYTGADQREFIMDWASLERFREERRVKVYNLHPALNDEQLKEVAEYQEMDQTKMQGVPVSDLVAAANDAIFKGEETLLSFEDFTKFIERCKDPANDAVAEVEKLIEDKARTEDTVGTKVTVAGVIKLIEDCRDACK